jgi:hypothetical protein
MEDVNKQPLIVMPACVRQAELVSASDKIDESTLLG